MKMLVTGGCGFIGANFIYHELENHDDVSIVTLDKLTYAGNLENLEPAFQRYGQRLEFVKGDIADAELVRDVLSRRFDVVVNFAAESHVDRSIEDSLVFLQTNVIGTQRLLEAARSYGGLFVQVSTDEVYGSLGKEGKFSESSPLAPNSPYAASKASADLLVRAYSKTHGLSYLITRCSNNYGPYQFPEKLIPLIITNALEGKSLPIYGDGLNVRDWIFVRDHCSAIDELIRSGARNDVFNIGGSCEKANLDLVRATLRILEPRMGKPEGSLDSLLSFVKDRPGHDRRYAMDHRYLSGVTGWEPRRSFDEALEITVSWYLENRDWWTRIKQGDYQSYYERMYVNR